MVTCAVCFPSLAAGSTAVIGATLQHVNGYYGFEFVLGITIGSLVMVLVATVYNNLDPNRKYPTFWY